VKPASASSEAKRLKPTENSPAATSVDCSKLPTVIEAGLPLLVNVG
jgi:hypothetical protein